MDYAPYVLFKVLGNGSGERYLTRDTDTQRFVAVSSLHAALRFESAQLAYWFGEENGLSWWRVGKR